VVVASTESGQVHVPVGSDLDGRHGKCFVEDQHAEIHGYLIACTEIDDLFSCDQDSVKEAVFE
jgi:hypothetical protein